MRDVPLEYAPAPGRFGIQSVKGPPQEALLHLPSVSAALVGVGILRGVADVPSADYRGS